MEILFTMIAALMMLSLGASVLSQREMSVIRLPDTDARSRNCARLPDEDADF